MNGMGKNCLRLKEDAVSTECIYVSSEDDFSMSRSLELYTKSPLFDLITFLRTFFYRAAVIWGYTAHHLERENIRA